MEKLQQSSSIRKMGLVLSVLLLIVALTMPAPSAAKDLKLLSSWPENMTFVEGCLAPLSANLKELSDGSLSVKFFGPDVVPTMEQFQPVQSGVFDLLLTIPGYHMGTTAVGAAIDAVAADPVARRESGVFAYVDEQYNALGVKLLAMIPIAKLNILTRMSISDRNPSLDGLKIRTTTTLIPVVEALGGTPVNMPAGEVYTALQKGVIDGTAVITFGIMDLKWNEVTKHIVRPTFGHATVCLLMNLDKYNGLSDGQRQVLDEAGRKTELDAMAFFQDKTDIELKRLLEFGLTVEQMQPADAQKADDIYTQTVWEITEKKSGDSIAKLHRLAVDKGLSK